MNDRPVMTMIGGRPLCYRVRKSRRARKLGLSVSRREGVLVTLPQRVGYAEVPALLEEYGDWLSTKADEFDVRLGPKVRQYGLGSRVLVYGAPRRIEVRALPAGRVRSRCELADGELMLALPVDQALDVRPALETYLRKLAHQDLPGRVAGWAGKAGLHPGKVIIGERTTRWGSCSARGTISLCYRLVMAPPEVIDAVVAHEVCHLAHLDHSERFYALLDQVCPWHRESRRWLNEHHEELVL